MPTLEGQFILETAQLRLDELEVYCTPKRWASRRDSIDDIVSFLRRLPYTKVIKFILCGMWPEGYQLPKYCAVIGALMKEDHHQRYDAPGAPNIGATWWDWKIHHNTYTSTITFEAQDPLPVLPEEEYLLLMKPRIDAMMAMAERAAGIGPHGAHR
ncbi:hypothetical protein E8E13_003483 [Curvularia kusanoi]|uniref:Uncharacterized protein n=1 Tax=Curvularia kusanoi TaxID=90978 RepID=A0A9P4T6R6_CURKU|nr:hypothetical protein E8E13_003483 [Curvularia kusanoi]